MSVSKRIKQFREMIDPVRLYTFDEAIALLGKAKKTAFNQTVEVAVTLGIVARQSDILLSLAQCDSRTHGVGPGDCPRPDWSG